MAISGKQTINVGVQNQPTGSDSLYLAFSKTEQNFTTLFSCASPYTTFSGGYGLGVSSGGNTVTLTNTGVTGIIAGTGVTINQANGNVVISASGNGVIGVTSVGVISNTLSIANTPVVSSGNISVNLPDSGVTAGSYTAPTLVIDRYGRVTGASNTVSSGTVTSIVVAGGDGVAVTGSPITTTGTITITNTGVTRLNAGSGIALTSSNGNITVSATTPVATGTVTRVGVISSSLTVANTPVTTAGNITVDLPIYGATTSITANGTSLANATALTKHVNVVSTVVSGANGVRLPTPTAGMCVKIVNTSANTLNVFPATTGIINALSANASFAMAANARVEFAAASAGQWYTFTG
jgi:hypothetical protein